MVIFSVKYNLGHKFPAIQRLHVDVFFLPTGAPPPTMISSEYALELVNVYHTGPVSGDASRGSCDHVRVSVVQASTTMFIFLSATIINERTLQRSLYNIDTFCS